MSFVAQALGVELTRRAGAQVQPAPAVNSGVGAARALQLDLATQHGFRSKPQVALHRTRVGPLCQPL
ncbi:MAG: hypothetical protein R2748_19145 [Bryobacterales bacterium]